MYKCICNCVGFACAFKFDCNCIAFSFACALAFASAFVFMLTSHLHCSCFASAFVFALVQLQNQVAMASNTRLVSILDHIGMPDCKSKHVNNFLHHFRIMSRGFKKSRQAASQHVALTSKLVSVGRPRPLLMRLGCAFHAQPFWLGLRWYNYFDGPAPVLNLL